MKRLIVLALLAITSTTPAVAAPPPPPPPGRVELIANFFGAAPAKLPAASLSGWARYISSDVKVYAGQELIFSNSESWLAALNARTSPSGWEISTSIRYLQFYELHDGGIRALEWAYPYGKNLALHGIEPYRFVTYYFDDHLLVRVVYDQQMAPYNLRSGKQWQ